MRARILRYFVASGVLGVILTASASAHATVHWSLTAQGAPGSPLTEGALNLSDTMPAVGVEPPAVTTVQWETEEPADPDEVVVTKLSVNIAYHPGPGEGLKQISLFFSADAVGTSITPMIHEFAAGDGSRTGTYAALASLAGGPACATPATS